MNKLTVRIYLGFEFLLLFFGIPVLICCDPEFIHPSMLIIPVLLIVFVILVFTTDFSFRELLYLKLGKQDLLRNGLILFFCTVLLLLGVILFVPERLFDLPRGNSTVWLLLCIFYPVFSAYGQEIIYRTFLFKRYERLFPGKWARVLASGIVFSFLHIVYYSPVSIILTLLGGFYFADEYNRTGSVLFSAILHGFLGIVVFTVGLGEFFWLDMYQWISK